MPSFLMVVYFLRYHYYIVACVMVILLWGYSAYLRLPYIHAKPYTANDCHNILFSTWEIWDSSGIANCHFAPRQTYHQSGNKFITYFKRLEDQQGNNYYISYPCLSYITTYGVFQILDIHTPNQWSFYLYWTNLVLHLVSTLLLIRLILYQHRSFNGLIAAILAATVYLLLPPMLHLHLHIYFPEMYGQIGLLLVLVFAQTYIHRPTSTQLILLCFATFLLCYSEWLGLFLMISWWIGLCFYPQKSLKKACYWVTLTSCLSYLLTLFQFLSIAGWYQGIRSLVLRLVLRSGYFSTTYSEGGLNIYHHKFLSAFYHAYQNALSYYSYGFVIIICLFLYYRFANYTLQKWSIAEKIILLLAVCSTVMYNSLFINATTLHLHLWAKIAIPFSLLLAFLSIRIFNVIARWQYAFLLSIFVLIAHHSTLQYMPYLRSALPNPTLVAWGKIIQERQDPNAAIFVHLETTHPISNAVFFLTFYAHRNLQTVDSIEQAVQIAQQHQHKKIQYFCFDDNPNQFQLEKVELSTQ